jgi:hypothetical protein
MQKKRLTVEEIQTDLDLNEHLEMQQSGWNFQRVGLYCILIIVLTAAMGLYGNGVISRKMHTEGSAWVELDQFFRQNAKMQLRVGTESAKKVIISFSMHYLNHFEIDAIVPEPKESYFENDEIRYTFNGDDSITITFYLVPQDVGNIKGSLRVNENLFTINHLIFP